MGDGITLPSYTSGPARELTAVSMYTQLLGTALAEQPSSNPGRAAGASLAEVRSCRSRMRHNAQSRAGSGWAPGAVSDQLAYDVALVMLATEHGIDVELDGFERTHLGRSRLEQALAVHGVPMDDVEDPTPPAGWS
jgi:hypothetical protein